MAEMLIERDLHALMAVVEEGRRDCPTEGVPWAILDGLGKLVPGDEVTFCEIRGTGHRTQVEQSIDDAGERGMNLLEGDPLGPAEYWDNIPDFLPYSHRWRTGDVVSAVRWSDFYTHTELCNTSLFAEYFRSFGCRYSIGIMLSSAADHTRRINIFRETGTDFTERDRLVLELLRPHLYEVYLDAQRRRNSVPRLSPREWDVLLLADQGLCNADIARTLFISVATVRKHFEHVFDRTGARTRTAAAALMMPYLNTARTSPRSVPSRDHVSQQHR